MSRFLGHLKSNAVGYVALFVALGGTSYAAFGVPYNSVGTRQLRNDSVTSRKLARRSVSATSLDSKSIAGYVAFWAHVGAAGQVVGASPRATVITPFSGVYQVTWNRQISSRCILLATVTDQGGVAAYANALFEGGIKQYKGAIVQTFSATGAPVFEPFNVAVICP